MVRYSSRILGNFCKQLAVAKAVLLLASGGLLFSALPAQAQELEVPRVVLLLHGMNSRPDTWDPFLNDIGANAPTISKGVLSKKARERHGISYYTVRFGVYDKRSNRRGVENIEAKGNTSGDFTSFSNLGKEVRLAVEGIVERHPGAEVLIVGHSRGGLAARAFLQDSTDGTAKRSVVGFLTLGTPHRGSHLGRLYDYLADHSRFEDNKTWNFVDAVRKLADLDVRRPTIGDLATGSTAIHRLNRRVRSLPTEDIKYRNFIYAGLPLGYLDKNTNMFTDFGIAGISENAENYVLQRHSQKALDGDGFVESSAQRFDRLPRVSSQLDIHVSRVRGGVPHTEEPERTGDILRGMRSLVTWSFTRPSSTSVTAASSL